MDIKEEINHLDFLKKDVKDSKAFLKMENIFNKLIKENPKLKKEVNHETIFKINKNFKSNDLKIKKNFETPVEINENFKKILKELESEKLLNEKLKKEKKENQIRNIKKEKEYRNIITKLNENINMNSSLNDTDKQSISQINHINNNIIKNIEYIQNKTSRILLTQEKDIIEYYNNIIIELKKDFELKNEKQNLRDQDFLDRESKLLLELEWIKKIAEKIDNENHKLIKKYKDLKIEADSKENDKKLILNEIVIQQNKQKFLEKKLEYYNEQIEKIRNEDIDNNDISNFLSNSNNIDLNTKKEDIYKDYKIKIDKLKNINKNLKKEKISIKNLTNNLIEEKYIWESLFSENIKLIQFQMFQLKENNVDINKEIKELFNKEKQISLIYDLIFYNYKIKN